jgi:hypothetical protein
MKIQRSDEREVIGLYKLGEDAEKKIDLPWWRALNTSLSG